MARVLAWVLKVWEHHSRGSSRVMVHIVLGMVLYRGMMCVCACSTIVHIVLGMVLYRGYGIYICVMVHIVLGMGYSSVGV